MKCLCPFYTLGARFRTWGGFGVFRGGGGSGFRGGGGFGVSGGGGGHESVHVHVNFIVSAFVSLARCLFPGILAFLVSWGRAYVLCGRVACVISLLWVAWCHILCYCLPPHPVSHVSVVLFFVVCFDSRCIRVADNING